MAPTVSAAGILAGITFSRFFAFVARMHITPFFPELMQRYGVGLVEMGVLMSAFFVAYAALLPFAGWLADRASPRLQLAAGLALLAVGIAGVGLVTTYAAALALRVVEGIGSALVFPIGMKLFTSYLPLHQRGRAAGITEVAIGSALITTLTFSPLISVQAGVEPTTLFVAFGILCLTGFALLPRMPATQPPAIPGSAGAATTGGTGAASDETTRAPRLSRAMVVELLLLSLAGVLGLSVANGVLAWLPAYLETGLHFAKARVAFVMGLLTSTQIVSAYVAGTITDRMRDRVPIAVWGTILQGLGCVGLLWASDWTVWPLAVVVGVGFAWAITPMTLLVAEYFGASRAGVTTSVSVAISQTGSGFAAALFGWIAETTKGFAGVWLFSVALSAARLGLFLLRGRAWSRGRPGH